MAFTMSKKSIALVSIAAGFLLLVVILVLVRSDDPSGTDGGDRQKHFNSLMKFMTDESEMEIDPEKIEKFDITEAKIIQNVILEKTTVCAGEDFMVTVAGQNPNGSDASLAYRIGDRRGNPAILRFMKPGKREFYVIAQDSGSHVDFREVEINVVECPDRAQLIVEGKLAGLKSEEAEFEVVKRSGIGESCTYEWDFGDGSKKSGVYGYVTHNYALRDQKSIQSSFTVTVKASDTDGRTAEGRCSISLPNIHFMSSLLNDSIIPAQYESFPALKGSRYEVPISFKNIYEADAVFSGATIEAQPCSSPENTPAASASPGSLMGTSRIRAGETASDILRVDRSLVPAGTCNLVIRFTGELANRRPVSAAVYLNIKPEGGDAGGQNKAVSDKTMIEKLEKAARILGRGRPITPDDLKRLEKEGKL